MIHNELQAIETAGALRYASHDNDSIRPNAGVGHGENDDCREWQLARCE
jgi:hypothetical protein